MIHRRFNDDEICKVGRPVDTEICSCRVSDMWDCISVATVYWVCDARMDYVELPDGDDGELGCVVHTGVHPTTVQNGVNDASSQPFQRRR